MTYERPWREWRLRDWNAKLFSHCFGIAEGDSSPVSRIVVTPEELLRLTADERASPDEAVAGFQTAVLDRLNQSRLSLCKDASRLERATWHAGIDTIPPYFAHLIVTCIAASGTDTKKPKSEFRRRLNQFLNRGHDNPSYPLGALPRLWELLQIWLEKAAARGEPFRTLILERPDHLKLIGYSVQLAFPGMKDQLKLASVLANLTLPPPIAEVFERIDRERHAFTERFQHAYISFRAAYHRKESGLYSRSFWSAVIDAIRRAPLTSKTRSNESPRFLLRLDEDQSWRYTLSLLADRSTRETPRCRSRLHGDSTTKNFDFVVDSSDPLGGDIGRIILDTTISEDFPEIAHSDLMRAVEGRLLLFDQDEDGIWQLSVSRPSINKVRALIHKEFAEAFVSRVERVGCGLTLRPSKYPGWSEVGDFGAYALAKADFWGTPLASLRCLADVIVSPRITLSEGVRLDDGWLGRRLALPKISVDQGTSTLTIEPVQSESLLRWNIELEETGDEVGSYRIPALSPIDGDLEGEYILRSRGTGQISPSRVMFHTNVIRTDFRMVSDPAGWFVEGIETPTLSADDRSAYSVMLDEPLSETGTLRLERIVEMGSQFDESADVDGLVDIFAGISLRRAGIAEHELYTWFSKALGLSNGLVWDVIRAWVESGIFDQFTNRRWRNRTYFARGPQLAAYRTKLGDVGATLVGLVPSGFARRVDEESRPLGITAFRIGVPNPHVPRPICLRARSFQDLVEFAARLSIDSPRPVTPLCAVAGPLDRILSKGETIPAGYVLERVFDLRDCRVEWHKRDDAPDFFVAAARTGQTFGTWSRNWAFLVASVINRTQPFERRTKTELVRSTAIPAHLPVVLARWVTIVSGISPRPTEDANGGLNYTYQFPNARCLDEVIGCLWPTALPADLTFKARWIHQLVTSRADSNVGQSVQLPSSTREAILALECIPGCERLAKLKYVPLNLYPHFVALACQLMSSAEWSRGRKT